VSQDKPAPVTFQDGWNINPDMIVEMPREFHVPATGTINYQNIRVKVNFPEDKWVVAAEMRPGNPKVLHHDRVIVLPPGSARSANRSILPSIGRPRNGNMFVRPRTVRVGLLLSEGEVYSLFTSVKPPC
jgi:hypothetical protein